MNRRRGLVLFLVMVTLSGCATIPAGPSVMVLPAPGKSFEAFQSEDLACRQWAEQQAGRPPAHTVNQSLASGAALGTLMGAGLGAAVGAASGNAGTGAAIGAATGLIAGTATASGSAYAAGWEVQRRYDMSYQQCMYAKGNQVPARVRASRRSYGVPPPPPGFTRVPAGPPPTGGYLPPPPPPRW
jgi:hypothetical protein